MPSHRSSSRTSQPTPDESQYWRAHAVPDLIKKKHFMNNEPNARGSKIGGIYKKTHCAATASHIHRWIPLTHYNAIVIRAGGSTSTVLIRSDLDVRNILALVGQCPKLSNDLINILTQNENAHLLIKRLARDDFAYLTHIDLHSVIAEKCLVKSIIILVKIMDDNLSCLIIDHLLAVAIFNIMILTL